jgi:hypothetical protein
LSGTRSPSFLARFTARCIHATHWVDLLHTRFDRARSLLILAFASDQVFEAHNDVFHGRVRERAFLKSMLHEWEQDVVQTFFPPPPARVLVGGAGLGREAFPLAERGYSVVAFDRVQELVEGMRASQPSAGFQAYVGAYQDLPILHDEKRSPVDLRANPFDAAVIGWGSFSLMVSDAERVETLRRFAEVTRGPILVSFWAAFWENTKFWEKADEGRGRLRQWLRRRARRRGLARFMIRSGFNRLLTGDEIEQMAKEAGLSVLALQCRRDLQPYFVVAAPRG